MKNAIWPRAIAVAAVVLLTSGASVANATESKSTAPDAPEVCWLNTDNDEVQCFTDDAQLEAAVEEQTGTSLTIPGSESSAARAAAPAATYVLATYWDPFNKTGNSFTATTSNSGLCSGVSYGYASLGSWWTGWEDRVSSFQTYGNCRTQLWEEQNYVGSSYGPATSANSMGAMNNKASSIRIFS